MSYIQGICNFCGTGCGNLVETTENTITGVLSDPAHPFSQGKLCVRGWHIHELFSTEDRIVTPLIKDNNTIKEADYDSAIDTVVKRLGQYNGDEIGVLASPRSYNEENYLLMKLARGIFKTNNINITSDLGHRNFIDVSKEGTGNPYMSASLEEIQTADLIFVISSDITKVNPIIGSEIFLASQRGARVITLSSIKTQIAKLSNLHIQPYSGSIKACIACMAKAIIEDNLHDKNYLQESTTGFEGFANFLGSVKFEELNEIIKIDYRQLQEAAKELMNAKNALVVFSTGISGLDKDTISYIYNLFLLAGKIGKPGSGLLPVTAICNIVGSYDMGLAPDLLPGYKPLEDTANREKFNTLWNTELNPHDGKNVYDLLSDEHSQLKALIVIDHDEEIIHFADKIQELDFVVYCGSYSNPFTSFADVVFPITTFAETEGTITNTARRIQYSPQMVEPVKGLYSTYKLYSEIAKKAGSTWSYASTEDILQEISEVTPLYGDVNYTSLKNNNGSTWKSTIEKIHSSDKTKESHKFVNYISSLSIPQTGEEYPIALMIGMADHFWHKNNIMKKTFIPKREFNATLLLYPIGFVELNKEDAEKIGIKNKWVVRITSKRGEMEVYAKISDDIKPGIAYVPYFIHDTTIKSLLDGEQFVRHGEDTFIPVKIEKV